MIVVLIFLAPWLLLAALVWWAVRRVRARSGRTGPAATSAPMED